MPDIIDDKMEEAVAKALAAQPRDDVRERKPVAWRYEYSVQYKNKLECTKNLAPLSVLSEHRWSPEQARNYSETPLYEALAPTTQPDTQGVCCGSCDMDGPLSGARLETEENTLPILDDTQGTAITEEWCINMAKAEGDAEIGAGMPDHPLRAPSLSDRERVFAGEPYDPPCSIPPKGWRCTRKPGHEGPCAAIPDTQGTDSGLADAAIELAKAEKAYRLSHDLKGDGHPETGRAWDLMRRAGHRVRALAEGAGK